jgi:hypothetical protein
LKDFQPNSIPTGKEYLFEEQPKATPTASVVARAGVRPAGFPVESAQERSTAAARSLDILNREVEENPALRSDPSHTRERERAAKLSGRTAGEGKTPTWDEVVKLPEMQALKGDDLEAARLQYFVDVVAPQVPTEQLSAARAAFDADTKPGPLNRALTFMGEALEEVKQGTAATWAQRGIAKVDKILTRERPTESQAPENAPYNRPFMERVRGYMAQGLDSASADARARRDVAGGVDDSQGPRNEVSGASSKLGRELRRGFGQFANLPDAYFMAELGGALQQARDRATKDGTTPEKVNPDYDWLVNQYQQARDRMQLRMKSLALLPRSSAVHKMFEGEGADGLDNFVNAFKEDPTGASSVIVGGSLPGTLSVIAAATMARLMGAGLPATATAGGVTSAFNEYGHDYAELREKGMGHDEAHQRATIKSGVIGLFDAVSLKSGGKALGEIVDAATKSGVIKTAVKQAVKESGKQAALGAGGEVWGSAASGREPQPGEVAAEAVGELMMGVAEAAPAAHKPSAKPAAQPQAEAPAPVAAADVLDAAPKAKPKSEASVLGQASDNDLLSQPAAESDFEPIHGKDLRTQFTKDGSTDVDGAGDHMRERVQAALDAGRTVTLHIEGKPHPILGVDKLGIRDENGNPWGVGPILMGRSDDDVRIEFGAAPASKEAKKLAEPKFVKGEPVQFATERGAKLAAQWAVVEAGELVTSHDDALSENPSYPKEMQPRDRKRDASEMQISRIAQNLQPEFLGESPQASQGSPIVGGDGVVESGNARMIALRRAYAADGAPGYKDWLKANAYKFGLKDTEVDTLKQPVLVRIRTSDVNRVEFARQANESSVAAMSPLELARTDADRLKHLDDLATGEDGEVIGPSNRTFVRRFVGMLPVTEQAGLVTADGELSQSGATRVRNAILARAYGAGPVLQRLVESPDESIKALAGGLIRAAPSVAKARDAIADGALHDLDITGDLLKAVDWIARLRAQGKRVEEWLSQISFFEPEASKEFKELIRWLDQNGRGMRARRVGEFIEAYVQAVQAAGNPAQETMFADAVPTKGAVIEQAKKGVSGEEPEQRPAEGAERGGAADAAGTAVAAQEGRREPGDQDGAARRNEESRPAARPVAAQGVARTEVAPKAPAKPKPVASRGIKSDDEKSLAELKAEAAKAEPRDEAARRLEAWVKSHGRVAVGFTPDGTKFIDSMPDAKKGQIVVEMPRGTKHVFKMSEAEKLVPPKPAPEKPAAEPAPQPEKGFGEENKTFTRDRADKARDILRKKLGQLNAGLDPEVVQAGIELAGYYIEGGARTFADYSRKMVKDLGEAVRPYLKSWYLAVRNYPGFGNEGMESEAQLDAQVDVKEQVAPVVVDEDGTLEVGDLDAPPPVKEPKKKKPTKRQAEKDADREARQKREAEEQAAWHAERRKMNAERAEQDKAKAAELLKKIDDVPAPLRPIVRAALAEAQKVEPVDYLQNFGSYRAEGVGAAVLRHAFDYAMKQYRDGNIVGRPSDSWAGFYIPTPAGTVSIRRWWSSSGVEADVLFEHPRFERGNKFSEWRVVPFEATSDPLFYDLGKKSTLGELRSKIWQSSTSSGENLNVTQPVMLDGKMHVLHSSGTAGGHIFYASRLIPLEEYKGRTFDTYHAQVEAWRHGEEIESGDREDSGEDHYERGDHRGLIVSYRGKKYVIGDQRGLVAGAPAAPATEAQIREELKRLHGGVWTPAWKELYPADAKVENVNGAMVVRAVRDEDEDGGGLVGFRFGGKTILDSIGGALLDAWAGHGPFPNTPPEGGAGAVPGTAGDLFAQAEADTRPAGARKKSEQRVAVEKSEPVWPFARDAAQWGKFSAADVEKARMTAAKLGNPLKRLEALGYTADQYAAMNDEDRDTLQGLSSGLSPKAAADFLKRMLPKELQPAGEADDTPQVKEKPVGQRKRSEQVVEKARRALAEPLKVKIFASGMSRANDFITTLAAGTHTGVEIGEVSDSALEKLADAMAKSDAEVFVDSGAFTIFRANQRVKDGPQFEFHEFGGTGSGKALDFDDILGRYERLATMASQKSEAAGGEAAQRLWFVMPDIVGDQAGSIALAAKYAEPIKAFAHGNAIIPIQAGELTLLQAFDKLREVMGKDWRGKMPKLTIGIPSNAMAAPNDQVEELLRDRAAQIKGVHFLGAGSEKTVAPRMEAVEAAGFGGEVSGDANLLRSKLYGSTNRAEALRKLTGSTTPEADAADIAARAMRDIARLQLRLGDLDTARVHWDAQLPERRDSGLWRSIMKNGGDATLERLRGEVAARAKAEAELSRSVGGMTDEQLEDELRKLDGDKYRLGAIVAKEMTKRAADIARVGELALLGKEAADTGWHDVLRSTVNRAATLNKSDRSGLKGDIGSQKNYYGKLTEDLRKAAAEGKTFFQRSVVLKYYLYNWDEEGQPRALEPKDLGKAQQEGLFGEVEAPTGASGTEVNEAKALIEARGWKDVAGILAGLKAGRIKGYDDAALRQAVIEEEEGMWSTGWGNKPASLDAQWARHFPPTKKPEAERAHRHQSLVRHVLDRAVFIVENPESVDDGWTSAPTKGPKGEATGAILHTNGDMMVREVPAAEGSHFFAFRKLPGNQPARELGGERIIRSLGEAKALFGQPTAEGKTVDDAAHEAATSPENGKPEPTDAQKKAGNYEKGHATVAGLDISIENPAGSRRRPEWPELKSHYGYVKGTIGFDKDHLDIFIKPGTPEDWDGVVFVVNQLKANGKFDEHKVMLGWDDVADAEAGYLENYEAGWEDRIQSIGMLPMDEFAKWARDSSDEGPTGGPLEVDETDDERVQREADEYEEESAEEAEAGESLIDLKPAEQREKIVQAMLDGDGRSLDRWLKTDRIDPALFRVALDEAADQTKFPGRLAAHVGDIEFRLDWAERDRVGDLSSRVMAKGQKLKKNAAPADLKAWDDHTRRKQALSDWASSTKNGLRTREDKMTADALAEKGIKVGDVVRYTRPTYSMRRGDWSDEPIVSTLHRSGGTYQMLAEGDILFVDHETVPHIEPASGEPSPAGRLERQESDDAAGADDDLEQDSPALQDEVGQGALFDDAGRPDGAAVRASRLVGEAHDPRTGSPGVPADGAAADGERGDQQVHRPDGKYGAEEGAAGSDDGERGGPDGDEGVESEPAGGPAAEEAAVGPKALAAKREKQRAAQNVAVVQADADNVRRSLPFLMGGQQDDVRFAEERFAKADGHGVLFTNGTGTGKTFTGLGVVKRYERQGRGNIIIVAPTDNVLNAWIEAGKELMLDITLLPDVDSAGDGIVATTYANFGQNDSLAKRDWDLIVADEAHYLSSGQVGDATLALQKLRALTGHHKGFYPWFKSMEPKLHADLSAALAANDDELVHPARAAYAAAEKVRRAEWEKRGRTGKLLALSATPFAYVKNVDWADGYLFDYGAEPESTAYNAPGAYESFMVTHFGYRMRYNKLTEPEAEVDRGLLEIQFNEWLKKQGVLSSRILDVDKDYERRFVVVDAGIGRVIDEGMNWLNEADDGRYKPLADEARKRFGYLDRAFLLEAIKARAAIERAKKHLALGRKVVVFHDYNKGGGFHPFTFPDMVSDPDVSIKTYPTHVTAKRSTLIAEFNQKRPDLARADFTGLGSPLTSFAKAFPDALFINGTMSKKDRRRARDTFNADSSGKNLIVVQSDAGREGVSLHDTTGKHQRVLINLGLPVKPTAAIQIEGRTYRIGQMSDAIFEYLNTGTSFERYTFASRISERASTAENLALGAEARALKEAFIEAFEEATDEDPVREQGRGGKERDRATRRVVSEFEKAKTFYWANLKKTSRTKAAEGVDYFATPEPLAFKMVEWSNVRAGDELLEPSAGHGAIARFFPKLNKAKMVEPSAELGTRAMLVSGAELVQTRFEDFHIVNKADVIVMNPPFGLGGKTAMEHVEKAMGHLRDGGRIVALLPRGPMADKRLEKLLYPAKDDGEAAARHFYIAADIDLPGVTFERAGTSVRAHIVVLDRAEAPEMAAKIQQVNRDYSDAEDIKTFFDRIENGTVPERVAKPELRPMPQAAASSAGAVTGGWKLVTKTSDAGRVWHVAVPSERLGDNWASVRDAAKAHGGWYARAWKGFAFASESKRQEFLDGQAPPAPKFSRRGQRVIYDRDADGPRLIGGDFGIVQPASWADRIQGWTNPGAYEMFDHQIVDLKTLKIVGNISLGWRDDKVVFLPNIRVFAGGQLKGVGEAIIRTIVEHNGPGAELTVGYIAQSARGFWEKMGTRVYDTGEGEDGALTLESYQAARDAKGRRYGRQAQGRGRGEGAAGPQREGAPEGGRLAEEVARAFRAPSGTGLSVDTVSRIAKPIAENVHGVTLQVVREASDLPFKVPGDVQGVYWQGNLWLVAGAMSTAAEVQWVAAHELGHHGWQAKYGRRLTRVVRDLGGLNKQLTSAAEALRAKFPEYTMDTALEEALADRIAEGTASKLTGWQRFVAMVKIWLIEAGFGRAFVNTLTDEEVTLMVERVAKAMRGKEQTAGPVQLAPAFHRDGQSSVKRPSSDGRPARRESLLTTATRVPVQLLGIDRLTSSAYDLLLEKVGGVVPEKVKAGLVADYGIPEAVIDRRERMEGHMRVQLRDAQTVLDKLAALTRAESRVAYAWMNQRDADDLLAALPEESRKTLSEVRAWIDAMSREAVRLGQLTDDIYQRNRLAYLHRSYRKYELEATKQDQVARARSVKILGDQYKGRGMTDAVEMADVQNSAPDWWGRKLKEGKGDKGLKGLKFVRLERRENRGEGVGTLEGVEPSEQLGRLREVIYWPASEEVPARFGSWRRDAGEWEVRDTKAGKLILWRDFTAEERARMGEIDEVRFAVAKTLQQMIHDTEVGKFLEYVANTQGRTEEKLPGEATVVEASESMWRAFGKDEWVQVPEAKVPGTQVKKYGKLAGLFVPGPIWNDIRQVASPRYRPLGEMFDVALKAWKISKTALSPAVHMNNVMANVVMADWHDVLAKDLVRALGVLVRPDAPANKALLAAFEDNGGTQGMYTLTELQREQLSPLIDQLRKEADDAGAEGMMNAASVLQALLAGRMREAAAAAGSSKVAQAGKVAAGALIDLYQAEDTVFRLAAFLKAKADGKSDIDAGKFARRSFLDYRINAPWIQMLRSTVFPFIAFTYRAIPMLLDTAARKPWKMMKLMLVLGGLNALGYALSGGDEDKERKLLPKEKGGRVWGVIPKLLRMPWNDANGAPVFLDIRRFIPAGDVVDLGQTHAVIPWSPVAVPGGPLAVIAELLMNKSQFTGRTIVKETDTAVETAGKVADHLYKAVAPNLVILPGTPAFKNVYDAGRGKTDVFGRERSTAAAVASAFGVKMEAYPPDVAKRNIKLERDAKLREIGSNVEGLKRELITKGINREEFNDRVKGQIDKKKQAIEEARDRTR